MLDIFWDFLCQASNVKTFLWVGSDYTPVVILKVIKLRFEKLWLQVEGFDLAAIRS